MRIVALLFFGFCNQLGAVTPVGDSTRHLDASLFTVGSGLSHLPRLSLSGVEITAVEQPGADGAVSADRLSAHVEAGPRQYILSDIVINRRDIFGSASVTGDKDANDRLSRQLYRAIDALHVTTREKTIVREIDLEPGRSVFNTDVAELERNLRAMGLFASVAVKLVPVDSEYAELHIHTRDRLSVVFGASGSFLGGIGELGFTVGERNVNGSGDRLLLSYSGTTDGQLRGAVAYDDIHFIDRHHTAAYSAGRTEEGRFYHFQFSRPFKTLASKLSWSVKAESIESDIDYYENGVSVAQIPRQSESLILEASRRLSIGHSPGITPVHRRYFRYGSVLRFDQKSYEPTRGVQPELVDAPLDNTRVFAGAQVAVNRNNRFEKTNGVDSVQFTEDLSFGYSAELLAGVDHTSDAADVSETEPALFIEASYAFGSAIAEGSGDVSDQVSLGSRRLSVLPAQTFGKVTFDGYTNLQSSDEQSWSAGLTLKLFNRAIDSHTLAARISYVTSERGADLPTQYTLGENNGLRGYAARQFSGSSRLRINLEDRIFTGWHLGEIDVGLLAFVDAGWAGDDAGQLSLSSAAGVGLRLGSNTLLGSGVMRLDLAYPFDPVDGESGISVSLALGQVFSF